MSSTVVGIIGGTGLYQFGGLEGVEEVEISTPFGAPSSPIVKGRYGGADLLFVARHGVGHSILPSEINYRANIFALKMLGAQWCLSVSAVGSLKEEMRPGDVALPDQFIDRTRGRASTFFGNGLVAHIPFSLPVCPVLHEQLYASCCRVGKERNVDVHRGGTYLCMEGPAFSTRAESLVYRSLGASVIGMTNIPEAKLAREAEIAYATLALITDYDCWHSESPHVDYQLILETLKKNGELAKEVIEDLVGRLVEVRPSELASRALANSLVTPAAYVPRETKERLRLLISRYMEI